MGNVRRIKDFDWVAPVLGIALVIIVVGVTIWWHVTHKCVEEEDYTCSRTYCAYEINDVCAVWQTDEDTCTRCLRWEKR